MSDDSKRWTDDARERQAQVCRDTQPWKHSPSGKPPAESKRRFVHEALHEALMSFGHKAKPT